MKVLKTALRVRDALVALKIRSYAETTGSCGIHVYKTLGKRPEFTAARQTIRPLAPRLVVEVQYHHFSGGRFRHGTKLLHWAS